MLTTGGGWGGANLVEGSHSDCASRGVKVGRSEFGNMRVHCCDILLYRVLIGGTLCCHLQGGRFRKLVTAALHAVRTF